VDVIKQWMQSFIESSTERRKVLFEAVGWKLKALSDDLGAATELYRASEDRDALGEDLAVFGFCAILPPALRETLAGSFAPMLAQLMEPTGDADHDEHHRHIECRLRRIMDRIAASTYEEHASERPHPFEGGAGERVLGGILSRFGVTSLPGHAATPPHPSEPDAECFICTAPRLEGDRLTSEHAHLEAADAFLCGLSAGMHMQAHPQCVHPPLCAAHKARLDSLASEWRGEGEGSDG
jgi:hypothetical protein